MRKISLEKLPVLLETIAAGMPLFLPVDTKAGAEFIKYEPGMTPSDALLTTRSAKDTFFPQTENLMNFKVDGKKIEVIDTRVECEDFVVYGVRPCDARAFRVLDNVFLAEPVDTFYKNRRDHALIISLTCDRPAETCFCKTFGIDPANPDCDIAAYKKSGYLCLDAKTDKGQALLAKLENVCRTAASHSEGAFPPEIHAQARLLSREIRRTLFLRRLRPLPEGLPDRHEHRQGNEEAGR